MIGEGRHAGAYTPAARQADNAARALFVRRTPLEQQRAPLSCIPSGSGKHRQISFGVARHLSQMHGLMAARNLQGLAS